MQGSAPKLILPSHLLSPGNGLKKSVTSPFFWDLINHKYIYKYFVKKTGFAVKSTKILKSPTLLPPFGVLIKIVFWPWYPHCWIAAGAARKYSVERAPTHDPVSLLPTSPSSYSGTSKESSNANNGAEARAGTGDLADAQDSHGGRECGRRDRPPRARHAHGPGALRSRPAASVPAPASLALAAAPASVRALRCGALHRGALRCGALRRGALRKGPPSGPPRGGAPRGGALGRGSSPAVARAARSAADHGHLHE
jgi:hypothetical protein